MIETLQVAGVKHLKTYRGWALAGFTENYRIEADFEARVKRKFDNMVKQCSRRLQRLLTSEVYKRQVLTCH